MLNKEKSANRKIHHNRETAVVRCQNRKPNLNKSHGNKTENLNALTAK